jgi:phosphoribosyl-AMP cyclohydrolase
MSIPAVIQKHFDQGELVAAIAQDNQTRDVLMVAWMNQAALEATLKTSRVTYWSRSRSELWEKGLSSGNTQRLISAHYDCDGDAILLLVEQNGAACHTGEKSCFFTELPQISYDNSVSHGQSHE